MSQILKLNFTIQPLNSITGETQTDTDFGKILDMIFDAVPLKGNKTYSLYNNILVDIRNARRNDLEFIEMAKTDLEKLKEILLASVDGNPKMNRPISFLSEVIEKSMIGDTVEIPKENIVN